MRGLLQLPPYRIIFPSWLGSVGLLAVLVLIVSCGGRRVFKRTVASKRQGPVQIQEVRPPSPLETLESKVRDLDKRQRTLAQRRAEVERDFAKLSQSQWELISLRDEVLAAQREAAERAASQRAVGADALGQRRVAKATVARPPTPGGPGAKPFVVHTSSYRTAWKALNDSRRLANGGYMAYSSKADLGAKGIWYRVLVDRFTSVGEARSFARRLKERNKLSYAAPMRLPYAVALEAYPSMEGAREAKADLERKGLHPYVVKETNPGGSTLYRLRIGAFKKRSEAEAAAERAEQAGAASAVVKP